MKHHGYRTVRIGLAAVLLGVVCVGCPQLMGPTWYRYLGTDADDAAYAVARTSDGGYILAGYSEATPEDSDNVRLTKLNRCGMIQWEADFGDERDDFAYSVAQTADGGYVTAGQFGNENEGVSDGFLLKTDSNGQEEWRQVFDSGTQDMALSVQPMLDGGYLVGLELDMLGSADATMVKTNASGVEIWRAAGPDHSHLAKAIQMKDGSCIMAWWRLVPGAKNGTFSGEIGLLKTDAAGQEIWRKTLTDDEAIELDDVSETSDGGLILVGQMDFLSNDTQLLLWKTDSSGISDWRTTYGNEGRNSAHAVTETRDGGFVVAGETYPVGMQAHAFLVKTNRFGIMQWQRAYGGEDIDVGYDVVEAAGGGYLLVGTSESSEAEDEFDHSEIFLVKTDGLGHSPGIEMTN